MKSSTTTLQTRILTFALLLLATAPASAAQVELIADDWHAIVPRLDMTLLLTPVGPSQPEVLSIKTPAGAPPQIRVLRYHAGGAGTSVIVEVEKCLVIDSATRTLLGEADCAYRPSHGEPLQQPRWTWHADRVVVEASDGIDEINLDPRDRRSDGFDWRFFEESFANGVLRVAYEGTDVGAYEIDCSLEPGDTADDEYMESSRIFALDLEAYPNPVIVAECGIGAHSRQVLIFDPLRESKAPVLLRTGAFGASAQPWLDRLRLEYDRECDACEERFELRAESWPARDEAELPPRSMEPDDLVKLLYADDLGGLPLSDDPEFTTRLLSRELRRIIHEIEANPYPGELDFDPLVDGQDALLTDLWVRPARIDGRKATVEVSFKNFDTPVRLTFQLVLEAEGWRLDNIVSPHWDMRALLTAGQ